MPRIDFPGERLRQTVWSSVLAVADHIQSRDARASTHSSGGAACRLDEVPALLLDCTAVAMVEWRNPTKPPVAGSLVTPIEFVDYLQGFVPFPGEGPELDFVAVANDLGRLITGNHDGELRQYIATTGAPSSPTVARHLDVVRDVFAGDQGTTTNPE